MISYDFGNYGFLKEDGMPDPPLFLLDLGVERRRDEPYFYDNLTRPFYGGYLLQYTLNGRGIYEKDGREHSLFPGQGFLVRMPQDSRYYLPKQGTEGWEYFYFHFDGPAARPFYEAIQTLCGPVFSLPREADPVRLFFRLFEDCRRNGSIRPYEGGEFVYRFLARLLRSLEEPADGGSALVRQASAYLKEHFSSLSGIAEVAGSCRVSQEHLTRRFKRETGQTPLQYLTRIRMENALFYLLNTDEPVAQIARECGFYQGNYFARLFRRYLGCSPEEYRRSKRHEV
ncbi:MAG: AraC family transcriptional regulator [Eubacteriales bacterium]|nr:AraC family transcriptional regulator [Eubacteriales bacterium]